MNKTKICTKCMLELPISCYYYSNSKIHHKSRPICKSCCSRQSHNNYMNNKDNYKRRSSKRKQENRSFITELKSKPCMDCKQTFPPVVMEFDHKDPSKKIMNISKMIDRGCSKEAILLEVAKCELVCANCHRIRTFSAE